MGQFGFSTVNPRFGTKKSKSHKSTHCFTTLQSPIDSHPSGLNAMSRIQSVERRNSQLASVLWDARGIIFIDYLEKGQTVNNEYYMALLER
jgi:hypothetical protein